MNTKGILKHWSLIAAGCALALAGCGSNGNEDDSPPPTPPPTPASFQVTGQVVDAPIAGATVVASFGSKSFTATADASGVYTVTVEALPEESEGVVTLTARGAAGQPTVALNSILGSFAALQRQAGADGSLSRSENNGVNVTQLSTAAAALAMAANGAPIASDGELDDALKAVDPNLELDTAAAIKLVIDDGVALPAGVTDTLQLANDAGARTSFIADQQANNATAFAAARDATASDPAVILPTTAASVPAVAYAVVSATTPAQDLFGSDGSYVEGFEFAADGTGSYRNINSSSDTMLWSVDANGLIDIHFTQNPIYRYQYDVDVNGAPVTVVCSDKITEVRIRRLSPTAAIVTDTQETQCASGGGTSGTLSVNPRTALFVEPSQLEGIVSTNISGHSFSLTVYEPSFVTLTADTSRASDIVTFNADGTGTTRLRGRSFTWTLNPSGDLNVAYSNGVAAKYRVIRDFNDNGSLVLADFTTADGVRRVTGSISFFADDSANFTTATVPGVYYQYGVGTQSFEGSDSRLKGFALEFTSDGLLATRTDEIDDDGNGGTERFTFGSFNRSWVVRADSSISAQQYTGGSPQNCPIDTTASNCVMTDRRDIFPLSADDRFIYVLERRQTDYASGVTAQTPTTYLSRFYEKAPNGDYEVALAASAVIAKPTTAEPAAAKRPAAGAAHSPARNLPPQ